MEVLITQGLIMDRHLLLILMEAPRIWGRPEDHHQDCSMDHQRNHHVDRCMDL